MSYKPKTLLFLDVETTGLHAEAELLEIGALLVRAEDLVCVAPFKVLVQCHRGPSDPVWQHQAFEMHAANGLLTALASKSPSIVATAADAMKAFDTWLKKLGQPVKTCSIAGSSVHSDIAFLKRVAPDFDWTRFSHRLLDMSSIRAFAEIAGLKIFPEKKPYEGHRALEDCHQDHDQLLTAVNKAKNLWSVSIKIGDREAPLLGKKQLEAAGDERFQPGMKKIIADGGIKTQNIGIGGSIEMSAEEFWKQFDPSSPQEDEDAGKK